MESGLIKFCFYSQCLTNKGPEHICRDCLKQGQDSSVVIDQMLARPGFPLLGTVSYTVLLLHQVDWCRPTAGSLVQVAAGALVQALLLAHCTFLLSHRSTNMHQFTFQCLTADCKHFLLQSIVTLSKPSETWTYQQLPGRVRQYKEFSIPLGLIIIAPTCTLVNVVRERIKVAGDWQRCTIFQLH